MHIVCVRACMHMHVLHLRGACMQGIGAHVHAHRARLPINMRRTPCAHAHHARRTLCTQGLRMLGTSRAVEQPLMAEGTEATLTADGVASRGTTANGTGAAPKVGARVRACMRGCGSPMKAAPFALALPAPPAHLRACAMRPLVALRPRTRAGEQRGA